MSDHETTDNDALVILSRRAKGLRRGMGGRMLHRADCPRIRRSYTNLAPVRLENPKDAEYVQEMIALGAICGTCRPIPPDKTN